MKAEYIGRKRLIGRAQLVPPDFAAFPEMEYGQHQSDFEVVVCYFGYITLPRAHRRPEHR